MPSSPMPAPALTVDLRASHADRERVAAELHAAAGRGLLTLEEVDDRLAAAYAARHLSELAPLTEDLPKGQEGHPVPVPPGWTAITAATALQVRAGVAAAAERHRVVRGVVAHPVVASMVAALVLIALVLLARFAGVELD